MIILAVHLDQLRLEVDANLGEDQPQPVDGITIEHPAAIFRYKNQMNVQVKHTVPFASFALFELKPNGDQQCNMRRFAGSCRFVFNKALALQKERFEAGENRLGYAGLCKALTPARQPWPLAILGRLQ